MLSVIFLIVETWAKGSVLKTETFYFSLLNKKIKDKLKYVYRARLFLFQHEISITANASWHYLNLKKRFL